MSILGIVILAGPAGSESLGTSARQLPKGSLKLLTYYQGVQDQSLNFNIVGAAQCAAAPPNAGGAVFSCGQGGDVEVKGRGGAGLLKVVYQPWESLQYYVAGGLGEYSLSVPSATVSNTVTGDTPGWTMTVGAKAVLMADTEVSPALALDLSVTQSRYKFNRRYPGGTPGANNRINQALSLTQFQVAVEASHVFTLKDAIDKGDEKQNLLFLKGGGVKVEPYGGLKWIRTQTDLNDLQDGSHSGGQQDTISPFLGFRLPVYEHEVLFAEASFVDGYQYAAGLEIRF